MEITVDIMVQDKANNPSSFLQMAFSQRELSILCPVGTLRMFVVIIRFTRNPFMLHNSISSYNRPVMADRPYSSQSALLGSIRRGRATPPSDSSGL